jgi:hypothetical protein
VVDVCAAFSAGALLSDAEDVAVSFPSTKAVGAIAPRAGITVFPWPSWGFRAGAELPFALTRVHLEIEDSAGHPHEVWVSPPVAFFGYLGTLLRFR